MPPEHIFTHTAWVATEYSPEEMVLDPKMPIFKALDEAFAGHALVCRYSPRLSTVELVFGVDGDTLEEAEANTRHLVDETWTTLSLGVLRVVGVEVSRNHPSEAVDQELTESFRHTSPDPQISAWMAAAHRTVEEEQRRRAVIGPDATILNFNRDDPQSD